METSTVLVKFFTAAALMYLLLLGVVAGALPRSMSLIGVVMVWLLGRQKTA